MLDMVLEESCSPRTRERMDNLLCCNISGLPGGGLFRDKVIEIFVRSVKTKLRNLHTSMKDQVLDKAVASLSTISKIVDHDIQSMCAGNLGLQSSYDYIGDEARNYMREKIAQLDPFSSDRKEIKLIDKSKGLSPFTGMTKERLDQFAKRSQKNFKRNHPVKQCSSSRGGQFSSDGVQFRSEQCSSRGQFSSEGVQFRSVGEHYRSSNDQFKSGGQQCSRDQFRSDGVQSSSGEEYTSSRQGQLSSEGVQFISDGQQCSSRGQFSSEGVQFRTGGEQCSSSGAQFTSEGVQLGSVGEQCSGSRMGQCRSGDQQCSSRGAQFSSEIAQFRSGGEEYLSSSQGQFSSEGVQFRSGGEQCSSSSGAWGS
jgi:hypothetical protein